MYLPPIFRIHILTCSTYSYRYLCYLFELQSLFSGRLAGGPKSQSYFNESPLDHYYIGTYSPTYISSLQSISLSSLSREMGQLIDMYTRVGVVSAPPAVGHSCSCLHTLHTSCHHKEARYNKWSQFCWRKRMIVLTIANNV